MTEPEPGQLQMLPEAQAEFGRTVAGGGWFLVVLVIAALAVATFWWWHRCKR
jgi:hypothetical protein